MTLFYFMFFAESLNAARQFLAIPFCLLSLVELRRNNILSCVLFMFVAYGFHHSSLFFLIIFLLYYLCVHHYNLMKRRSTLVVVIITIVTSIIFFSQIMISLVGLGLADIKYLSRYASGEMYGTNMPMSLFAINGFNFMMLIWAMGKVRKNRFIVFSLYVMLLGLLFCFTGLISTFTVRLCFYFMAVSLICLAYLIKKSSYIFSIVVYSFYVFYWFMVVVFANLGNTYPYKSKILSSILMI